MNRITKRKPLLVLASCLSLLAIAAPDAVAPTPPTAPAQPAPPAPPAPPAIPDTDIFVADLDLAAGKVGAPRNLTDRPGYDNQPAFLPDGSALLYVAAIDGGPTDVWRYDFAAKRARAVTVTPEAEYSPTPIGNGRTFSAVRVALPAAEGEAFTDSQQLWTFAIDGTPRGPVRAEWTRVGYHAWIDEGTVAMFIVGGGPDGAPHTLVLGHVADGTRTPLARDIGRGLARAPDGRVTYVDTADETEWRVATLAPGDVRPTTLAAVPATPGEPAAARARDLCWLPDGTLLMSHGQSLERFDPRAPAKGWTVLATFPDLGPLSRIAVSRDGKRLAFVAERADGRTRGIRG